MVTTSSTPGSVFAALTSTDLMRPCATVLRKSLACSMPGSRMVWTYSARPVTLSRDSRRGTERPTWAPTWARPGPLLVVVAIRALRLLPGPHATRAARRRASARACRGPSRARRRCIRFPRLRHRPPQMPSSSGPGDHRLREFQACRLVGCGARERRADFTCRRRLRARPRRRAPASRPPSRW